jgi:hypothetical protein
MSSSASGESIWLAGNANGFYVSHTGGKDWTECPIESCGIGFVGASTLVLSKDKEYVFILVSLPQSQTISRHDVLVMAP